MVSFSNKADALKFASKRKKGFRALIKKEPNRKVFLNEAIKSVKVVRIKKKNWSKPIYDVKGF